MKKIISENSKISKHEDYVLRKECSTLENLLIYHLPSKIRGGLRKVIKNKSQYDSYWAINHLNFIQINTKRRVSVIMLDFDKISNTETIKDRFETAYIFNKYLLSEYIEVNVIVETNRGYQCFIFLESHVNANYKKSWYFYKAIKKGLIETIPYIDSIASGRTTGIARNPLKHDSLVLSLIPMSLEDFRDYGELKKEVNELDSPRVKILKVKRTENIKQKEFSISLKPIIKSILLDEEISVNKGVRKAILFQLAMIKAKPLKFDIIESLLTSYLSKINRKYMEPSIEFDEIADIISSVLGYHAAGDIFVKSPLDYKSRKEVNKSYYEKNKVVGTISREKNIKIIHESRKNRTKELINELLRSKNNEIYKKKNGSWNAIVISEKLGMSKNTIRKYLKEDN